MQYMNASAPKVFTDVTANPRQNLVMSSRARTAPSVRPSTTRTAATVCPATQESTVSATWTSARPTHVKMVS